MPVNLDKTPQKPINLKKEKNFCQKIKPFFYVFKIIGSLFVIILVLIGWVYFPRLFALLSEYVWKLTLTYGDNLGSIGDIYGSLNTLFTLLTLFIVLYSTNKQIETNQSIQKTSNLQLDIARKNHKEQMKESRRALFNEMFYSLLNYKREKFQQLNVNTKKGTLTGSDLTKAIYKEFLRLFDTKWSNLEKIEQRHLANEFKYFVNKISDGKGYEELYSYFYMYESIYKLINNEKLTYDDEHFYKDLVSNSMTPGEQITLVWIAASSSYHCGFLKNSYFIVYHMPKEFIAFAEKFLDQSLFIHPQFLKEWNEYRKDKNPA